MHYKIFKNWCNALGRFFKLLYFKKIFESATMQYKTEKLTFPRSQRKVFSHQLNQEFYPIEIKQETEISQFVLVENQPQSPNLDEAQSLRKALSKQKILLTSFLICATPEAA